MPVIAARGSFNKASSTQSAKSLESLTDKQLAAKLKSTSQWGKVSTHVVRPPLSDAEGLTPRDTPREYEPLPDDATPLQKFTR